MKTDSCGIIRDPGKFEGEHQDIIYWHDAVMDGGGFVVWDEDTETCAADFFEITDEDRANLSHPDKCRKYAILWHSDLGFESLEYTDIDPNEAIQ